MIVLALLAALPVVSAVGTLSFNMTLSHIHPIFYFYDDTHVKWVTDFPEVENYVEGVVGMGPTRRSANSSYFYDIEAPQMRFSFYGTDFYIYGKWDDNNTTASNNVKLRTGDSTGPRSVDGPGGTKQDPASDSEYPLITSSFFFDDGKTQALGPHRAFFGASTGTYNPGGGNLTIESVTMTLAMETDA